MVKKNKRIIHPAPDQDKPAGLGLSSSFQDAVQHCRSRMHQGDLQNKLEIEDEVSAFLGHSTPPAVEVIFVESVQPDIYLVPRWICGGWGISFGHLAVAFTRSDGSRRLINVTHGTGREGEEEMVEVWESPTDYLCGVDGHGGIFSRPFAVLRVQEWDQHGVDALENYLRAMIAATRCKDACDGRPAQVQWHQCGSCMQFFSWIACGSMVRTGSLEQMPSALMNIPYCT